MSMICRFFGKKIPFDVLERHCQPSKEGVRVDRKERGVFQFGEKSVRVGKLDVSDKMRQSSHDRIELRSEKVRRILGEVPNGYVRWGISIVSIIFITLIVAVMCMKYPYGGGETIFKHILG